MHDYDLIAIAQDKIPVNTKKDAERIAKKYGWKLIPKHTEAANVGAIRDMVKNVVVNIFNIKENIDVVADILMGQLGVETGFKSIHNYNVGNLMASKKSGQNQFWKGNVHILLAHEYTKDNKKYWRYSLFKSYDSLKDGVSDWASLLNRRFPNAVAQAAQGNTVEFVKALKQGNYFTASADSYLAGVEAWKKKSKQQANKVSDLISVQPTQTASPQAPKPMTAMDKIIGLLDSFLKQVQASEQLNKSIYKQHLPSHRYLIKVQASDPVDAVEFSRVLCTALNEELLAKAYTHVDGDNVEIECKTQGNAEQCYEAMDQLTNAIKDAFKIATKKIGGIDINTNILYNKKSSYQQLPGRIAVLSYTQFLSKFA